MFFHEIISYKKMLVYHNTNALKTKTQIQTKDKGQSEKNSSKNIQYRIPKHLSPPLQAP